MNMLNGAILSYKPIENDTRVQSQIKTLKEINIQVNILCLSESRIPRLFLLFKKIIGIKLFLFRISKKQGIKLFLFRISKKQEIKIIFYALKSIFNFLSKIILIFFYILKSILNFLSKIIFFNNSIILILKFIYFFCSLKKKDTLKDLNIIIANDLYTLPFGIYLKIKHNCKLIYDMHEYELDRVPKKTFISTVLLYLSEEVTIPFADYITTVSYSIKQYYKKRFNKKIFLIFNSPIAKNFPPLNKPIKKLNKLKKYIMIGNISYGRNVIELIEIFKKTDLELTFMGHLNSKFNKEEKFLHKIKSYGNIHYKRAVKPEMIGDILQEFDATLFLYDLSYKNYDYALPNKFILSLIMRKPIISFESTELKLFEKRHSTQLNLINNLNEINNLKVLNKPKLNISEINFYSSQRQALVLKRVVKNLCISKYKNH